MFVCSFSFISFTCSFVVLVKVSAGFLGCVVLVSSSTVIVYYLRCFNISEEVFVYWDQRESYHHWGLTK